MNSPNDRLEAVLRQVPQPQPPASLRHALINHIPRPGSRPVPTGLRGGRASWLRYWWPGLVAAGLALASLIWVTGQHRELQELREALNRVPPPEPPAPATAGSQHAPPTVPLPNGQAELERLRATVHQLSSDVAALETLRSENARLKSEMAAQAGITAEEFEALQDAREKAVSIQCINNLKQLGLAARVWALDNGEVLPPDFLSMTNEIGSTKVLICPADPGRSAAGSWSEFGAAHVSYEHLAPSAPETEPERVLFRCPVHGHIALCDGSVQARVAFDHPEWLSQRDGKLYCQPGAAPAKTASPVPAP